MYQTELSIKFAICVATLEDEDLETWKIYRVLPDAKAREVECLRIIDESWEDYLYPQNQFVVVELPEEVQQKLLATEV